MQEQTKTMTQFTRLMHCPICASNDLRDILEISQIPVLSNVLWEKPEDALSAPLGEIRLVFCESCGHVFNQAFDPDLMKYNMQYENSLHFSPVFQSYATWLAHYLVNQYDLYGKKVIEIGSGRGDFLRLLCEYGGNTGTGFDPSYESAPGENHSAMTFVKDVYSDQYATYQADLIVSRHVLEHIDQPANFIQHLRQTIGDRKRTVVFFEVPNLDYILRDTAIWDIIYEHFSYFSARSLAALFTRCGFNILNLANAFEGQFLYIEAIPRNLDRPSPSAPAAESIESLASQVVRFAGQSQGKRARWNEQVEALRNSGKRVVLWGAGSKGISFLNMLHVRDEIEYVVDINPRKRGKYITGAGQQIVPPEFLQTYQPDTIIVMNPIYREEIKGMVDQLGLHVDYLFAS